MGNAKSGNGVEDHLIGPYVDRNIHEQQINVLKQARGEKITRVGLEQWSIEIVTCQHRLRVEGEWSYLDSSGVVIDKRTDLAKRSNFELWRAVGHNVVDVEVTQNPFTNLTLRLSNGYSLVAFGDDDDFEDWEYNGVICMRTID